MMTAASNTNTAHAKRRRVMEALFCGKTTTEIVFWPRTRTDLCKSCGLAADQLCMDSSAQIFFENFAPEIATLLRDGADSYAVSLA
jgi:hypothetical protein